MKWIVGMYHSPLLDGSTKSGYNLPSIANPKWILNPFFTILSYFGGNFIFFQWQKNPSHVEPRCTQKWRKSLKWKDC